MPSSEQLDAILTVQLVVAWAGESGDDEPRLRWWETDLVSKYGGHALFEQLAPRTAQWAVLEAAREAARRADHRARHRDAEPDRLVTLFSLGFELDEKLQDRLLEHKRHRTPPEDALPGHVGLVPRQFLREFVNRMDMVDQWPEYEPMGKEGLRAAGAERPGEGRDRRGQGLERR